MIVDPLFDLSKEVVVVTGARGRLGRQYVSAFLKRGSKVVALDLDQSANAPPVWPQEDKSLLVLTGDVTNQSSLEQSLKKIQAEFGTPSVLINNAGIDSPPDAPLSENGPFETYPNQSWDDVMNVNVKGVYLACKVIGGEMAKAMHGSIINVSSIYGVVSPDQQIYEYRRQKGEPYFKPVAYSVSKSALLNLTRYLAVYWARANVRVNTLVLAGVEANQDQAFKKAYCERIPVGRMAMEDEYNGAVLFMASAASRYMTGAQVIVDGGWTAI